MKRETENKQYTFSFKKGHTLPMSDEYLDFLEKCQKALMIGNLRGMIVDNNDDGKPSFFQTTGIGDKKAKMALTFYKRFSDINKFTHFLVHEDDLQYYKDFIENFALENCQIITHRLRGKSTEYKIAFVPPVVSRDFESSFNIRKEYLQDMETLTKFEVGSAEQDKQIKYMLQKYVAICLNYTDGKLNEVYTDHGNITVIVYKDNKMFTNVYYKVNKITGEKIEFRDFDNIPKMFNARINGFKGKKTMTYDFILMNPPYDKNLHLKILEQSIPMLTDDGILVNLSPIRWLQDPLARYKKNSDYCKFEESVAKHIKGLEVVPTKKSQEWFMAGITMDLGVYVLNKQMQQWYETFNKSLVLDKLMEHTTKNMPRLDSLMKDGIRVRIPTVLSSKAGGGDRFRTKERLIEMRLGKLIAFEDGKKDGKWWYEYYARNQFSKCTEEITLSIKFSSNEEADRFIRCNNTLLGIRYYYQKVLLNYDYVRPMQVFWLGDCINPRTGKKGYESDWTDDDFKKYFDITDSEWEEIVETMKPFL